MFKLCWFVAEVLASCILNYLLHFLSCIKKGYLNKAISSKSTKRQVLIQEYFRLLYSCVGLGGWFFVLRLHPDLSFLLDSKPNVTLPRIIRVCFWASKPKNSWEGDVGKQGKSKMSRGYSPYLCLFWFTKGFFWCGEVHCSELWQTGRKSGMGDHSVWKCTLRSVFIKHAGAKGFLHSLWTFHSVSWWLCKMKCLLSYPCVTLIHKNPRGS